MNVFYSPLFILLIQNVIKARVIVVISLWHSLSNIHVELTEIHFSSNCGYPPRCKGKDSCNDVINEYDDVMMM